MNIETFSALRNYAKGKIDRSELMDSSDLFSNVSGRNRIPGDDIIDIEFPNEEEFLRALGLHDDDIWFYQTINSPYGGGYEFMDSYSVNSDFEDGYRVYYELNDENKELLSQISKSILPMKVDFESEEYRQKLSEKLLQNFRKQTDDILEDYRDTLNYSYNKKISEVMTEEMDEYFSELGINAYREGFNITVADLISLYLQEGYIHLPLKKLLENIFNRKNAPGNWLDDAFNYDSSSYFDSISFNDYTSSKLNQIMEIIEESGEEEGVSIKDFTDMTERVSKKFMQGKYYFLPKDPKKETRFKIEGFEFPQMKVVVTLSKKLQKRTISLSEQSFYNLLYQPSLFNLDEI